MNQNLNCCPIYNNYHLPYFVLYQQLLLKHSRIFQNSYHSFLIQSSALDLQLSALRFQPLDFTFGLQQKVGVKEVIVVTHRNRMLTCFASQSMSSNMLRSQKAKQNGLEQRQGEVNHLLYQIAYKSSCKLMQVHMTLHSVQI